MDDSSSEEYLSADEGLEEGKLGDAVCSEGNPEDSSVVSRPSQPIIEGEMADQVKISTMVASNMTGSHPEEKSLIGSRGHQHLSDEVPANTAQNGCLGSEKTPVPPPRTKRKKKYAKSSLEDLAEVRGEQRHSHPRSLTLSGTDPRKELNLPYVSSPDSEDTPEREAGEEETCVMCTSVPSRDRVEPMCTHGLASLCAQPTHSEQRGRLRLGQSAVLQDKSRSTTPTPAICIEPELEWTSDILSGPESEVVTSHTSLAKARGPTTTTPSVLFPSDDESGDGGEEEEEELIFLEREVGVVNQDEARDWDHGQPAGQTSPGGDSDNQAILESTMVTNLDTGEVIPLSAAEQRIPQGHDWSPLSEHLLRRTKEMAEAEGQPTSLYEDEDAPHRRKTRKMAFIKLKKWGRRKERLAGEGGGRDVAAVSEELGGAAAEDRFTVKYKQSSHKQGEQEFDRVRLKQDLTGTHLGAIWCMEFSICGRLLATAGQDSVVRVWVLVTASHFFHELQAQYQRLGVHSSVDSLSEKASVASSSSKSSEEEDVLGGRLPFQEHPLCSYCGHTADILDLSWSKNFFLLSSSMDKTVRLWHISRKECLCCFQHVDFVTAIAFHPRDDRYFLSGSLDGKLRLWNIPDKRVALWNEIEGVGSHLITAASFCMNGKLAVVGTYDGRCIFFDTEHLKYHTQIHVKSRHGKNKGRKISGVEPLPGEDKLLVTSNDSRVRLYNLKDHELLCKYKGYLNTSSQIKATFSRDGQYIISGSEDNFIYIWRTHLDLNKLSSARRDRNEFYESFTSHSAPITTAVFAPVPGITVDEGIKEVGEMVVAADYQGCIKVYVSGETL